MLRGVYAEVVEMGAEAFVLVLVPDAEALDLLQVEGRALRVGRVVTGGGDSSSSM